MFEESEVWEESQKSYNPEKAYELYNLILKISESRYFAGWLIGIEKLLWDEQQNVDDSKDKEVLKLRSLCEECKGWWKWEYDDDFPKFLHISEAENYFINW